MGRQKPAHRTEETSSDKELRRRRLQDPGVRARVQEILDQMERGEPLSPGITAEELPDFLREHG